MRTRQQNTGGALRLCYKIVTITGVLVLVFGGFLTTLVPAQTAAASSDPVVGAVNWAENLLNQHVYDGLCLQFVHDAYLYGGGVDIGTGYSSALDYWNRHVSAQHAGDTNAPEGALVFWGATPYGSITYVNPDGHVALSLGGGVVISSDEEGNPNIHEFNIASRNAAGYPYLGWMMPPGVSAPSSDTSGQLLWKLRNSNSSGAADASFYYGASTDTPVTGDWNGDGSDSVGIARQYDGQLLWKLRNSNSSGSADDAFYYGPSSATPIPGNWDGVGTTTVGVARTDDGSGQLLWELRNANGGGPATYTFHYGPANAIPVVGDWDGNGTVTIGVVRKDDGSGQLLWELRNSDSGGMPDIVFHYGATTDIPVAGDWNADGVTTIGIARNNDGSGQLLWKLRNSNSSGAADASFYYGASTDRPVVGDWNGNGQTTIGIVRG